MAQYDGVMHVHSRWSDGELGVEEIGERAKAKGLDFVILNDHAAYLSPQAFEDALAHCRRLSDSSFLFMLGLEYEWHGYHALVIGPPDVLKDLTAEEAVMAPERAREKGAVVIWAHPAATYSLDLRQGIEAQYDGWEVWSGLADGPVPSLPMLKALRQQRAGGRQLLAFGGVDFHKHSHIFNPILQVEMPQLDEQELVQALRAGRFIVKHAHDERPFMTSGGEVSVSTATVQAYALGRYLLLRLRAMLRLASRRMRGKTWH